MGKGLVLFGLAVVLALPGSAWAQQLRTVSRFGYKVEVRQGALPAEAVSKQRDQVSAFLQKVDRGMRGQPMGLFDRVVIAPCKSPLGRRVKLDVKDRTLRIEPRVNPLTGKLKVVSATAIEKSWDKGRALALYLPGKARKGWRMLNPVGTARVLLRNAIADGGKLLAARLDTLVKGRAGLAQLKQQLGALISEHVRPDARAPGASQPLAEQAQAAIQGARSRQELVRVARAWKGFVESPANWSAMTAAAVGAGQVKDWAVTQVQLLGVQFQNFKEINVGLQASLGAAGAHLRAFLPQAPTQTRRRNRQIQLAGVQVLPVDHVNVNVAVEAPRALSGAGLHNALAAFKR
jgi:hypothetical protein